MPRIFSPGGFTWVSYESDRGRSVVLGSDHMVRLRERGLASFKAVEHSYLPGVVDVPQAEFDELLEVTRTDRDQHLEGKYQVLPEGAGLVKVKNLAPLESGSQEFKDFNQPARYGGSNHTTYQLNPQCVSEVPEHVAVRLVTALPEKFVLANDLPLGPIANPLPAAPTGNAAHALALERVRALPADAKVKLRCLGSCNPSLERFAGQAPGRFHPGETYSLPPPVAAHLLEKHREFFQLVS